MSSFTIRFIKKEDASKDNDDIIRISKDGENFVWNYKDADVRGHMVATYTCWSKVVSNLYTLLKSAAIDSQPADSIQVFTPGFPSFLVDHNALTPRAIETIVDCFTAVAHNWPVYESPRHTTPETDFTDDCPHTHESTSREVDESYNTPQRPTSRCNALPRRSSRTNRAPLYADM